MGGQPGKPKPPGNPPVRPEPQEPKPIQEPPTPIPVPPVERPPAPIRAVADRLLIPRRCSGGPQAPKVRNGLPSGGERIRTFGSAMRSHRRQRGRGLTPPDSGGEWLLGPSPEQLDRYHGEYDGARGAADLRRSGRHDDPDPRPTAGRGPRCRQTHSAIYRFFQSQHMGDRSFRLPLPRRPRGILRRAARHRRQFPGRAETGVTGSRLCYVPASDGFQVGKLREAGALVLAKSNMAEFAR
jgi:hypothetical protein